MTAAAVGTHEPMAETVTGAAGNNVVDISVGFQIKARRERLNLTLTAMSAASSMREQDLNDMETGDRRASAAKLREIAGLLGVDVAYFYRGLAARAKHRPQFGTGPQNR